MQDPVAWDLDKPNAPLVFRGHLDEVVTARFSPDGTRVAAVLRDGQVRVWQLTARGLLDYLRVHVRPALMPEQRIKFPGEPEAEAWTNYMENDGLLGRVPQLNRPE